jgi:D-threo-aldose 1-dehydrogenase
MKINSRVGFGTASLHHILDLRAKLKLLNTAYDSGIRYFDTAPLYGHGEAEKVLGQFVRGNRSQSTLVCATKVGLVPNVLIEKDPKLLLYYIALRKITTSTRLLKSSFWQPNRDYSSQYLVNRVESSLRKMGLDCLDIVLLHEPTMRDLEETENITEAVLSLKKRGLVRAFGISSQIAPSQSFKRALPDIADIIQIEMPLQPNDSDEKWIAENADATFGHFRVLNSAKSAGSSDDRLRNAVARAVQLNPSGTILFSSTKNDHVESIVAAIAVEDNKNKAGNT